MKLGPLKNRALHHVGQGVRLLGLPASISGYRWPPHASPEKAESVREITRDHVEKAALPVNVGEREELPDLDDVWGLSFRDVPERRVRGTRILTVRNARVLTCRERRPILYRFAVFTEDDQVLRLSGTGWRGGHGAVMRSRLPTKHVERAVWFLDANYRNFSMWIRRHMTKLNLLREEGVTGDLVLPDRASTTPYIADSLRLLGIDPARQHELDPDVILNADELITVEMDPVPPQQLIALRDRLLRGRARGTATRRVFISREGAQRRRLDNEREVWTALRGRGFERVRMEDLSLEEQVDLMGETEILVGLHGAGLTNLAFCPAGSAVIEIGDPDYPNPNFYALSAALDLRYCILPATGVGAERPWARDLRIGPDRVLDAVDRLT